MRKIIFIFIVIIYTVACKKENTEQPLAELKVHGIWRCEGLEAHLLADTDQLSKDVNGNLSSYSPNFNVNFGGDVASFYVFDGFGGTHGPKTYFYSVTNKEKGYIVFTENNNSSKSVLVVTGYTQNDKLHLKFLCADFKILVTILSPDYPFNPSMLDYTKGGYVTLIFEPIGNNG